MKVFMEEKIIIERSRAWVEEFVVRHGLCPFAKPVLDADSMRLKVSKASELNELVTDLQAEVLYLEENPDTETTLLIGSDFPSDFLEFNEWRIYLEEIMDESGLTDFVQIASFHPEYYFGGTQPEDAENYTNRSPYPMLHLIRQEEMTKAIESFPGDTEEIPMRNISRMEKIGAVKLEEVLKDFQTKGVKE